MGLDDSQWTAITLAGGRGNGGGAQPGNGHAWYRTVIELPATVGGKDIRGARVRLMVRLSNDGRIFFLGVDARSEMKRYSAETKSLTPVLGFLSTATTTSASEQVGPVGSPATLVKLLTTWVPPGGFI